MERAIEISAAEGGAEDRGLWKLGLGVDLGGGLGAWEEARGLMSRACEVGYKVLWVLGAWSAELGVLGGL